MRTIVVQLREAFEASGLSVPELLELADLDLNRSSLHRKLAGDLDLKTDEAEALATALKITLTWPNKTGRAKAS